jgi:hypothetical protein
VFSVLFSLSLTACETSSDGKEWVATPNAQKEVTQVSSALDTGLQKVCSGVSPGFFRDSIIAPNNWSKQSCIQWAASIGTSTYQLGCLNGGTDFAWGPLGSTNFFCGWQN